MINDLNQKLKIKIEEQFIHPKSGDLEYCEDFIFIDDNFIAVIDGATSKLLEKLGNDTPGRIAGKLICQSLSMIPANATAREAVDMMTATIQEFYSAFGSLAQVRENPALKTTASIAIVSLTRKEIWLVGDCQVLLNHKSIKPEKYIDRLLSEIRAIYLDTELILGKTIDQLLLEDTGRSFILPILRRQQIYQNNPDYLYWYPAIDGFPVPDIGIVIEPVTDEIESIILATDGYPYLHETYAESERALKRILEDDPLLFRVYKSTKGKLAGQDSFDDRAYIRLSVG